MILISTECFEHIFELQIISKDNQLHPQKMSYRGHELHHQC
jgi:hypothetical protein